jgi:hypothetical protein
MTCFGRATVLIGQKRSPRPPARITACIALILLLPMAATGRSPFATSIADRRE